MPSTQEPSEPSTPAFMRGGRVAFMPAARARESLPERRPSSFKNKLTEWWNGILAAGSDVALEGSNRLTAQLNGAIESVFRPDQAKKLTSIVVGLGKARRRSTGQKQPGRDDGKPLWPPK